MGNSGSATGWGYLIVLIIMLFFEKTRTFAVSILGLSVLVVSGFILWAYVSDNRSQKKRVELKKEQDALVKSARRKTNAIVKKHIETLANRRDTLVRVDRYGVVDGRDWTKEVQHFVDNVIRPSLTDEEASAVHSAGINGFFQNALEDRVARHCETRAAPATVPDDMSPADFEGACAAVLRAHGWDASTTKGSGDQGADVVAEKDGRKLVLQCKLYSGVVGNKSIQEVIAARIFYDANLAAVVCKTSYTKSARQLAQASGVTTLVFGELPEYITSLGEAPEAAAS